MQDTARFVQRLVDQLTAEPGVRGALLLSPERDRVVGRGSLIENLDAFAVMGATLHGAARGSLASQPGHLLRVVAERGRQRVIAVDVGHEHVLVVLADTLVGVDEILLPIEAAASVLLRTIPDPPRAARGSRPA